MTLATATVSEIGPRSARDRPEIGPRARSRCLRRAGTLLGVFQGKLAEFLAATDEKNSEHKQIAKFTEVSPDGTRRFKRDDSTKLEVRGADLG